MHLLSLSEKCQRACFSPQSPVSFGKLQLSMVRVREKVENIKNKQTNDCIVSVEMMIMGVGGNFRLNFYNAFVVAALKPPKT